MHIDNIRQLYYTCTKDRHTDKRDAWGGIIGEIVDRSSVVADNSESTECVGDEQNTRKEGNMGKLIGTVRAAELLKRARSYVGYLIYTRQLKATRPARAYLLDEDDVLAFKATRRQSKGGRWVSSLQRPELDRVRKCFDENKHLLDKRAVKMLVQHFGLDGRPPMTLAEIGKRQKPPLTRARVGQIINRALARIGAR